jgi:hypothetical protein
MEILNEIRSNKPKIIKKKIFIALIVHKKKKIKFLDNT